MFSDHNIYSGSGPLLLMCILYITAQYIQASEGDENMYIFWLG